MARTATKAAPEAKAEGTKKNVEQHWINNLYTNDRIHGIKDAVTPLYKSGESYTRTAPSEDAKPDMYAVKVPYEGTPTHQATILAKDVSFKGEKGNVFSAKVLSFDGKIAVTKDIPKQGGDDVEWAKQRTEIKTETVLKNIEKGQAWKPEKSAVDKAMAKGEAVADKAAPEAEAQAEA